MSGYGHFLRVNLVFLVITGISIHRAEAQEPPAVAGDAVSGSRDTIPGSSADSLEIRVRQLEMALDEIQSALSEQKEEDELEALMKEAELLSTKKGEIGVDLSKKYFSGVRQQQGLNPNISFGMDFFGGVSTSGASSITEPGDISYGNNGFYLREAQLSLIAPLDPYTRGKAFIAANPEGFFLDEVYMEWLNLPLGMNLKAGLFKPEFGFLNRYHDHALPQFDRPRVLINMFGTGTLGGTGLATNFLLPSLIAHSTTLDISIIYGNNPQSFRADSIMGFMWTGQFLNFYDLSASSYLEIRLSGAAGRNDYFDDLLNSYVGSAGIAYKWAPVGREKYRTLEWKSEFIYGYRTGGEDTFRSKGFYSSIHNKLGARFWIGGRIGYSEIPYDPDQSEWDFTLSLDFWQSDFVLTRFQYQYNSRNITGRMDMAAPFPSDHTFIIQVSWAMGPHKHEAY
jgi:hypothetical protein